jgi:ATP-binding cassette subfamily C protein
MFKFGRAVWLMTSGVTRFKLFFLTLLSLIVAFLDAIALYLFAQVISGAVQDNSYFVEQFLTFLRLEQYFTSPSKSYAFIIILALTMILVKSICTLILSRTILRFLSNIYSGLSEKFVTSYFRMDISEIKSRPNYEIFLAVNGGIKEIFVTGIFSYMNFFVEVCVLITLIIFVLINSGVAAIGLMSVFLIVFLLANNFTSKVTFANSLNVSESGLAAAIEIQSVFESIREIRLFGTFNFFLKGHTDAVKKTADSSVKLQTAMLVPKIILESSFMIGVGLFTLWKLLTGQLSDAISSVTFIVALGSRIIPSLLRISASFNSLKQVRGTATFSTNLIENAHFQVAYDRDLSDVFDSVKLDNFDASISLDSVDYSYSKSKPKVLSNVSFQLTKGQSLGIVGVTGSGKSTTIDLVLGFVRPDSGSCKISGVPAHEVVEKFGHKIGYVPQNISLIDGTLKQNILLGRSETEFSENDLSRAIAFAGLNEYINSLNHGLEHKISRAGSELSGGQKQKIGLARAVLSSPGILVLDEPTSSLDPESEDIINSAINQLHGKVTLLVVSHRLTTMKQLQQIAVMEEGSLVAVDTFDRLLETNSTFKNFVKLSQL